MILIALKNFYNQKSQKKGKNNDNIKKLIVADSILTTTEAAPIVRLFELTTNLKEQANYKQVGVENLTTSIKNEGGTLQCTLFIKKMNLINGISLKSIKITQPF